MRRVGICEVAMETCFPSPQKPSIFQRIPNGHSHLVRLWGDASVAEVSFLQRMKNLVDPSCSPRIARPIENETTPNIR
jgi:hypothetical protein